jgi:hypothetical protein
MMSDADGNTKEPVSQRDELADRLNRLPHALFAGVVFKCGIQVEYLPTGSQAEQAIWLVREFERRKQLPVLTKIVGKMDRANIEGDGPSNAGVKAWYAVPAALAVVVAVIMYVRMTATDGSGPVSGKWHVVGLEYGNEANPRLDRFDGWLDITQSGTRIVGKMSATAQTPTPHDRAWPLSGYFRHPYFAFSYESGNPRKSGTGVFLLELLPSGSLFRGFTEGVQCKANEQVVMRCPCLVYLDGQPPPEEVVVKTVDASACQEFDLKRSCNPTAGDAH